MDGETALLLQNGNAARIISCKESLPSLSYKRFLDLWTSAHLFLIRDSNFRDVVLITKSDGWGNSSIVTKWQCCKNNILQGITYKSQLQKIFRFVDFSTFVFNS